MTDGLVCRVKSGAIWFYESVDVTEGRVYSVNSGTFSFAMDLIENSFPEASVPWTSPYSDSYVQGKISKGGNVDVDIVLVSAYIPVSV